MSNQERPEQVRVQGRFPPEAGDVWLAEKQFPGHEFEFSGERHPSGLGWCVNPGSSYWPDHCFTDGTLKFLRYGTTPKAETPAPVSREAGPVPAKRRVHETYASLMATLLAEEGPPPVVTCSCRRPTTCRKCRVKVAPYVPAFDDEDLMGVDLP
jgi:hypothetical protein